MSREWIKTHAELRASRRAAGKCTECGGERMSGRKRCKSCVYYMRNWQRRHGVAALRAERDGLLAAGHGLDKVLRSYLGYLHVHNMIGPEIGPALDAWSRAAGVEEDKHD